MPRRTCTEWITSPLLVCGSSTRSSRTRSIQRCCRSRLELLTYVSRSVHTEAEGVGGDEAGRGVGGELVAERERSRKGRQARDQQWVTARLKLIDVEPVFLTFTLYELAGTFARVRLSEPLDPVCSPRTVSELS